MTDRSWREIVEVFPLDLQVEVETRLETVLRSARSEIDADHAFISFIQPEERAEEANLFRFSNGLWIGEERLTLHVLNIHQGLTGQAVREKKVLRYPNDSAASGSYVESDPRVVAEIVGPVRFRDKVTGVVVLDRVARETEDGEVRVFSDAEKARFTVSLRDIEKILQEVEFATDDARMGSELQRVAKSVVEITRATKRGYVAIKRPFGRVNYYKAGADVETFRRLATDEGLTGKVFQDGEMINCGDVLDHPDYVASDKEIRSELVVPIKDGDQTVGIINVESTRYADYSDVDEVELTEAASKLAQFIRLHHTSAESTLYYALGDLSTRIAQLRTEVIRSERMDERTEEGIVKALLDAVDATLSQGECGFWPAKRKRPDAAAVSPEPPAAVRRLLEDERRVPNEALVEETGEGRLLVAPLFASEGIYLGAVWARMEPGALPRDQRAKLEQLCLMATSAIKEWRREYRLREFLEVTDLLMEHAPSAGVLDQVVRKVPHILQSDYCTLFHRVEYSGERILVPTASSVALPLETSHEDQEPFYRWKTDQGLTVCAAVTATPLALRDVEHSEELSKVQKELGVPELRWRRHLSEDMESRCRSFMAFPIWREGSAEVVGVIRTHRTRQNPRPAFSDEGKQQMSMIARLLSPTLSSYLADDQ